MQNTRDFIDGSLPGAASGPRDFQGAFCRDRNRGVINIVTSYGAELYWTNLNYYDPTAAAVISCSKPTSFDLVIGLGPWPDSNSINTDTLDDNGFVLHNPPINPLITGSGLVWSAPQSGVPYLDNIESTYPSAATGEESPFYSYICNYGSSATFAFQDWLKTGAWTGTLSSNGSAGMNTDFSGTITVGSFVFTFDYAIGWSGTGVSGNTGSAGTWSAGVSFTLAQLSQITIVGTNMNFDAAHITSIATSGSLPIGQAYADIQIAVSM